MLKQEDIRKFGTTDLLMLLVTLVWAVNYSIVKIALRDLSPGGFNGIRMFFSALILLIVLWASGEGFSVSRSDFWKIVGLGLLGCSVYQSLFIHGINLISASHTSMVMAITPVLIALFASLLKSEKIPPPGWAGILVSFVGFYLVVSQQGGGFDWSWHSLRGDFLIFAGNVCWALYTVLSRPILERISPLKLATLTLALGTLFYIPFTVPDIRRLPWSEVGLGAWASLAYSGLFAIVISFVIWYSSLKRVGNTKTGIYGNITPVFAAAFAYAFLNERITPLQMVGALVIFLGFYLTRWSNRNNKK